MTGLTEADITRLVVGLILTRKAGATPERKTRDAEQETRIIPALYDETNYRMLLDVARQDLRRRENEILELVFPPTLLP